MPERAHWAAERDHAGAVGHRDTVSRSVIKRIEIGPHEVEYGLELGADPIEWQGLRTPTNFLERELRPAITAQRHQSHRILLLVANSDPLGITLEEIGLLFHGGGGWLGSKHRRHSARGGSSIARVSLRWRRGGTIRRARSILPLLRVSRFLLSSLLPPQPLHSSRRCVLRLGFLLPLLGLATVTGSTPIVRVATATNHLGLNTRQDSIRRA
mmetsp:Transcript_40779/g.118146  ORF Transcript_40779/g.118146 Transcript_40779/m.118146 type:complete len:212 (+) Transcript_40779:538-1173(+)